MASLENYPLEPPPPGQTSNFIDPKDRGPAITTLCSVFLSLMWVFYLLRLYSKVWIIRGVGWEDGKIVPLPIFFYSLLKSEISFCCACSGKIAGPSIPTP